MKRRVKDEQENIYRGREVQLKKIWQKGGEKQKKSRKKEIPYGK